MKKAIGFATAALVLVFLVGLVGCQTTSTTNTQAAAPAPKMVISVASQEAFANKVHTLLMDKVGIQMAVKVRYEDKGVVGKKSDLLSLNDHGINPQKSTSGSNFENGYNSVLVFKAEYMSEILARKTMHSGLLEKSREFGFDTVRFETARRYSDGKESGLNYIWQYNTTYGSAQTGLRECKINERLLAKYEKAKTDAEKAAIEFEVCTWILSNGDSL